MKLERLLKQTAGQLLTARLNGSTVGLNDTSASGLDMSVAAILARNRFSFNEIVQTLLTRCPHGVAARDGWDARTERLAKRCAFRALDDLRHRSERRRKAMEEKLRELKYRFSTKTNVSEDDAQ
ncbi:hypothetical protein [Roseovarius nubinhibens]|uniref:hypothetical protein n=1 Tax=Roseovarius nubinhibens TaxID=314263 RepID=UPI001FE399C4|nr:hypothetical protein [Roseovarius nubinhibens]